MANGRFAPLGYEKFRSAVKDGAPDQFTAKMVAYAQYLSNGGTPQGWMQLTDTDVLLMQTYYNESRYKEIEAQAILIANYIGKLFGGDKQ